MLSRFSSNVILSKVRAMYSKHMTKRDYDLLLACKSVSEIAYFLKHRSGVYSQILEKLDESKVRRGQLENLIRKKIFRDSISICRYELSVGEQFAQYIIKKTEVEQILHTLRLLLAGKSPDLIYTMPIFFSKHASIDFPSLTKVKNYKEFLDSISNSIYSRLLPEFDFKKDKSVNFLPKVEIKLYTYLYDTIFEVIKNRTQGNARRELYEIFNSYVDLFNFTRIIRLKQYYNMDLTVLYSFLLPFGTFKQKHLRDMINVSDYKEVFSRIRSTSVGRKIAKIKFNYVDELPLRINYELCNHYIRFSSNPSVVMFSYITLTEIELSNIINIIEGTRYSVASGEILKNLIQ
ncbi:MAG: V-type ATPase subunit [Oscillospiraceae bacterium]|nr:V-type ATPase subunit [Oscillospiraceae bacterium]